MSTAGRRPTPQAVLAARGSKYAKGRPDEPIPPEGVPAKPEWLGDVASAKWDELVPLLSDAGLLSPLFGDFLSQLCLAVQDVDQAESIIQAEGPILTSEKTGARYLNPAVGLKLNAIERLAKFGREFGMSPSAIRSVSRVGTPGPRLSILEASARSHAADKVRFFR